MFNHCVAYVQILPLSLLEERTLFSCLHLGQSSPITQIIFDNIHLVQMFLFPKINLIHLVIVL